MRVLIWDIENLPGKAYIWRAKTEWVTPQMMIHPPFMVSYAAKWQDSNRVMSGVLTPEEALAQDDSRIVGEMADLLRQADKAVAHNGDRFDIPVLNSRILINNLQPLGSVQTIDTLKLARKSFELVHSHLGEVAKALGLEDKLPTSFSLWEACYNGDPKALRRMVRYNRQDVRVLQQVYERLIPHVKGLPRLVDAEFENQRICPTCGSEDVHKDGYYRTNAGQFQRYRCQDCGANMRSRVSIRSAKLAYVPLAS